MRKESGREVERLRAENANLKTHPEGFSAETMQSMTDEVERLRRSNETLSVSLGEVEMERDAYGARLAKAVAVLQQAESATGGRAPDGSLRIHRTLEEIGEVEAK